MLSPLGIAVVVCFFVIGTALVIALAVRAGAGRTGGSIARILYDTEQSEKTR